jgi:hypothetical protein
MDTDKQRALASGVSSFRVTIRRLWADGRALCRNRNYVQICLAFSTTLSVGWGLLAIAGQMLRPCGVSDNDTGNAESIFLGVGVIAGLAIAPVITRTRAYLPLAKIFFFLSIGATLAALATTSRVPIVYVFLAYVALGLFLMPLVPICIELVAEVIFPISPDNGTSVMFILANTGSMILTFAITPLLEIPPSSTCRSIVTPAAGVMLGFAVIGFLCILPVRKDYRRTAAEYITQEEPVDEPLTLKENEASSVDMRKPLLFKSSTD